MKVKAKDLTIAELQKVLRYDPTTGELFWIKPTSKKIAVGSRAGSLVTTTGYRSIYVFGTSYPEHRLIWFMYYHTWPKGEVDHEDQDRSNNRITNLRDVSKSVNARNKGAQRDTVTGHQGVWYNKKTFKYVAEITMKQPDGKHKKVWQRTFPVAKEAVEARNEMLVKLGFHENHGKEKGNLI